MTLSSPNRMICCYFKALRQQVHDIMNLQSESVQKEDVANCVFLAITVIEAFVNIFFRIVVSEHQFNVHEQRVLKDLSKGKSLDYKIRNWPTDILGDNIDWNCGIGKKFMDLKKLRNSLIHFTSSHSNLETNSFKIQGLSDTSVFDSLTTKDAIMALTIAESVIAEILRIRGYSEEEIKYGLQLWIGKVPC